MNLVQMERVATQTLLGVRFWDRLNLRPVSDGLRVTAQRLSADGLERIGRLVMGRTTPSGVIAFFGLSAAERVADDRSQQIWEVVPAARLVAVDFVDTLGRYLPMSFIAQLPFQGAFRGIGGWLATPLLRPEPVPGGEMGVQLWPAPAGPLPAGRAVVRAQLVAGLDSEAPPAAHALVEAVQLIDGAPSASFNHFGITDANGTLMLPLPYPPVPDPLNGEYPPLEAQDFQLSITVRYNSASQQTLPGSVVPNLETILTQPVANIVTHWSDDDPQAPQTATALTQNLRFGRPLVLRTAFGAIDGEQTESVLRIQTA